MLEKELDMRLPAVVFAVALTSLAQVASAAPGVELSTAPKGCQAVAQIPRSARIADPAFSARVSAASCVVDGALARVPLSDTDASIQALGSAAAPTIATFDEVASRGGPQWQIVALYMKADVLAGMQTRLRNSLPTVSQESSLDAALAIEQRHQALDRKLEPWAAEETAAFRRITQLAIANPRLASADPVLEYMVREAAAYTIMEQAAEQPRASSSASAR